MTETGLDIEGQLKQARAHMYEGRFDAALQCAATILQHDGKNIDGLYIKAVCERYLGHTDNALMGVELLKSLSPDFGRAYQEEGHIFKAKGDDESALAAYRRACQCNPSLQASWNAQADIFDRRGQRDAASDARGQAQRIAAMPKPLVAVSHLLYEGKLVKAENACRHFLQNNPHNIEAMRLLADIGSRLGILEDADFLLESALEFEPDNIQVRIDYIQILRKRQKFSEALKQSEILYQ